MDKKVANIFPTTIVAYDNPKYLDHNTKILQLLDKEEFSPPPDQPFQTIDNHLERREEFQELYSWFYECLEDYRKTFRYDCDTFEIVLSWANKSDKTGAHKPHIHPNSFLSAIYYISENPSPTFFEDPRYQIRTGIVIRSATPIGHNVWPCPSETGSLVIFPSWLEHYTDAQENLKGWRYTISFNVLPRNIVNEGTLIEANY